MGTVLYCYTTGDTTNKLADYEYNFEGHVLILKSIEAKLPRNFAINTPLYLCCNAVEDSLIIKGSDELPVKERVLKQLIGGSSFYRWEGDSQHYFDLKHSAIKDLRLYIIDGSGEVVKKDNILIRCTIELKPKSAL